MGDNDYFDDFVQGFLDGAIGIDRGYSYNSSSSYSLGHSIYGDDDEEEEKKKKEKKENKQRWY